MFSKILCEICGKSFTQNKSFLRHRRNIHPDINNQDEDKTPKNFEYKENDDESHSSGKRMQMNCKENDDEFHSSSKRMRMGVSKTSASSSSPPTLEASPWLENANSYVHCNYCDLYILKKHFGYHERLNSHKLKVKHFTEGDDADCNVKLIKSAYKNRIATSQIVNKDERELSPTEVLENLRPVIISKLRNFLFFKVPIKYNIELFGKYIKLPLDRTETKSFQTKMSALHTEHELMESFSNHLQEILTKMSEFQERDSGWALSYIRHFEINVNKYQPLKGSSYIVLPSKNCGKESLC